MNLSELTATINSPTGLSDEQRKKFLHTAFANGFKSLENRGILKPMQPNEAYATGPDILVAALFEEAVPVRDGMRTGQPMTRREISGQLKR